MKLVRRAFSATSAAVVSLSSLMTIGFTGVAHAAVQTCSWTGTAGDNKFSTAGNWTTCGGGVPLAGDIIQFGSQLTTPTTVNLTNDLGVALGGVVAAQVANSDGASTYYYGRYVINTLTLADGGSISNATQSDCDHHAQDFSVQTLVSSGSVADHKGAATYNAHLQITGNFTTSSSSIYADSGSSVGGSIIIEPYTGMACGGGGGGLSSGSSITGLTVNALTVLNGGSVSLADASFPLTLGGGSSSDPAMVNFYGDLDSGNNNYVATTRTVSSTITLNGNAKFYVGDKTTVNVTGAINGASYAISRDENSSGSGVLDIQSSNNNSQTQNGKITNPEKTTTISDSQPSQSITVVDKETTVLDGERQYVTVNNGGVLKGTGTAKSVYVADGGTVAPGHSPGKLTVTSTLSLYGTYQAELKDASDGGFDQIVVGSPADTSGSDVVIGTTAILDVQLYAGAKIAAGNTFKIIDNLSGTAVSGTFSGLPEGATFKVGNGTMKISYVGGDGNDVVLTAMTAISAPDTGFALVAAHPITTFGIATVAAAMLFGIARLNNRRKLAPARAKVSRR